MTRIRILILLLYLLSVGITITGAEDEAQAASIFLSNTSSIKVPHLSIGANWTYPYDRIPLFRENQTINGSLSGAIELCISPFSITEMLRFSSIMPAANCSGRSLILNQTQSSFVLSGIASGLYTLSALDGNDSQLNSSYLLVSKENLSLQLPESILAGEPMKVKANISPMDRNQSLIFGAIMISEEDYRNISLNLTSRESGGYNSTLRLGNRSEQLPELNQLSMDLAMKLMYLLPSNSAVGLQESQQPGVELFMITDQTWPKGEYILTAAVYSKQEGLLGLGQQKILVT